MSKRFNGRFFPEGRDEPSDDPEKDFPIVETVRDYSGTPRRFMIELHRVGLGFSLRAQEEAENENGYESSAFDSTSPYLALAELRKKMHRALATRHLVSPAQGADPTMLHGRLAGHIGWSEETGGIVFVADGSPLTLDDIERLASDARRLAVLTAIRGPVRRSALIDEFSR